MELKKKLIIAVDGYSSCGKSTFAKTIAAKFSYIYIDTGAMYRAVTLYGIRNSFISKTHFDAQALIDSLTNIDVELKRNALLGKVETFLNGENVEEEIRELKVSQFVSQVSAIREVRRKMVDLQRKMSEAKGVILDGRDIGTVVFPNADIKLFMTADPHVRARRRFDELIEKGQIVSYDEIYQNIVQRDQQDTTRAESPLTQASDAIILDNSYMTPEQQMEWFVKIVERKFGRTKGQKEK
jgi:CMP/dCMP kinase